VLSLDTFKLVILCAEHVDISYNPRISKVVESIVNNKTRGAAGVEYGMVSVLDTWTIEVWGWVRLYVKRSTIDAFIFAFCPLMDNSIIN